jgi:uncharacterized protein YndB with AHSA1/START domain
MVPEEITQDIVIDAPVQRVWDVITEAGHIRQWFAFDGASIDLRPGGALVFHWKEHGTHHARIEVVEPPHRFAYRWAHRADEQPTEGNSTLVEFSLTPEGSTTRLRVVESGFRALDLPEAEQATAVAENTEGWSDAFSSLRDYLQRAAA